MNSVMVHLRNRMRFTKITITAKNSQGNSKLERGHRAMNNGFIAQVLQNVDDKNNWPKYVEGVLFSINTMMTNGTSPAMLLFGFQPKFAPDLSGKSVSSGEAKSIDHGLKRMEQMRVLHATFMEEKKFVRNLKRNERVKGLQEFKVGDLVWLFRKENRKGHKVSKKYQVSKTGPVTVTRVFPVRDVYMVEDVQTGHRNKVHSKFLSPCGVHHDLPDVEPVPVAPDEGSSVESCSSVSSACDDDAAVNERNIVEGKRNRRVIDRGFFVNE